VAALLFLSFLEAFSSCFSSPLAQCEELIDSDDSDDSSSASFFSYLTRPLVSQYFINEIYRE